MSKFGRSMKGCIVTTLAAFAIGPSDAAAQASSVVGVWRGTLVAGPQQVEIVFRLDVAEDGTLSGSMDVPAQGASGIPLTTVSAEEGTLRLTFPVPGGGAYEGTLSDDGTSVSGTFTQAGQPFPMELSRSDGAPARPARPQEPSPPFPYVVEEASFDNETDQITLAGTLTLPEGDGPFPAAVLISGSGPQDRDESLLGHKPFLVLADHLTRHGIAVLRYDDRGVGESTGDFSTATSEHFADDALAGIAHLVTDPRIDAGAIGIVGHSEGGLVGPMAARRSASVSYVVMLAGPGVTGLEVLIEQGRLINAANGTPPEVSEFNATLQRRLATIAAANDDRDVAAEQMRAALREEVERLSGEARAMVDPTLTEEGIERTVGQMNSPWFRYFLEYDPRGALEAISVPVLALFGAKDLQVPPDQSAEEVRSALTRGGNPDATVRVMPGLNHLFQEADTGSPTEYQSIEETFNERALSAVSDWIVARFGPERTHEGS